MRLLGTLQVVTVTNPVFTYLCVSECVCVCVCAVYLLLCRITGQIDQKAKRGRK